MAADFVLVYRQRGADSAKDLMHKNFRILFENELKSRGLRLDAVPASDDGRITFVKVRATWDALSRQAEFLRLQMPIMANDLPPKPKSTLTKAVMKMFGRNPFALQKRYQFGRRDLFTDAFDRRREKLFLMENGDREKFFTQSQRLSMTWDIISGAAVHVAKRSKKQKTQNKRNSRESERDKDQQQQTRVDDVEADKTNEDNVKTIDIQYLLKEQVYIAAYPMHDGECTDNLDYEKSCDQWPARQYLYKSWANAGQWYRHQPLDEIRNYFGEKVSMYFAWLGFYTKWLIVPSIGGLLTFLLGWFSLLENQVIHDFCNDDSKARTIVCRMCPDTVCHEETVRQNCGMSKISAVFDNESTVIFSFFMAIWAVLFLEFWKRRQAELCARWDVSENEFSEEKIRIEYQLKVSTTKYNPVTKQTEPYLPMSVKLRKVLFSILVAVFFVLAVMGLLAAVMVYKTLGPIMWRPLLLEDHSDQTKQPTVSPQLMSSITASLANGIFIAIMTKVRLFQVYFSAAWTLTNSEYPRTESDFEISYTYKIFAFQFVNFYGALFYLAFVRGQFVSPPNEQGQREARCPITGCLLDVTIQLAIIMIGKQALNNLLEIGLPSVRNWWRRRKFKNKKDDHPQWELDFKLDPVAPLNLSDDYLEMLIQYGFVTMFVAAFPLAPLFALLNNVIEIRLDARKHLAETRRCIPIRAKDLGPWFILLTNVTKIAVLTNALLIAMTTDFVDRLLYAMTFSHDGSMTGYTGHIFSHFDIADFQFANMSQHLNGSTEYCIYRDYRFPPHSPMKYEATKIWWQVVAAKLLFVVFFEHAVLLLQSLISCLIPDMPDYVKERQQREQLVQRENFMNQENEKDKPASAEDNVNLISRNVSEDAISSTSASDVQLVDKKLAHFDLGNQANHQQGIGVTLTSFWHKMFV